MEQLGNRYHCFEKVYFFVILIYAGMAVPFTRNINAFYDNIGFIIPVLLTLILIVRNRISFVDKKFIFAFPVACLIIRLVLRPYIWRWLKLNIIDSETIANYITNYLCLITLSVEVFIILYVYEFVKHITVILFVDTFVLIGGLLLVVCQSTQKK